MEGLEVGEGWEHVVEPVAGVCVAAVEAIEAGLDRAEGVLDAGLLALEEIDGDRVGAVGLPELLPVWFEPSLLLGEHGPFVIRGTFELVEDLVQRLPDRGGLLVGE